MIRYTPVFASVSHSAKIADLPSDEARLFYFMLLPQCDQWGRCNGSARKLNAIVWPLLGKTPEATDACIGACAAVGLINVYESDGERWIQIPDWEDKAGSVGKKDHRRKSEYPAADDSKRYSGPFGASPGRPRPTRAVPRARVSSPLLSSLPDSDSVSSTPSLLETKEEKSMPRSASADAPSSPTRILTDAFNESYLRRFGEKYAFAGTKDGKIVQDILRLAEGDHQAVLARLRFGEADPFHSDKLRDWSYFLGAWNKLVPTRAPSVSRPNGKPWDERRAIERLRSDDPRIVKLGEDELRAHGIDPAGYRAVAR